MDLVQFAAQFQPRSAAGILRDPGQQQGQPAQDDVGADPFFLRVVDGARVDDLLHVPPAALDFEQLLVADGEVFCGELRVGGPQVCVPKTSSKSCDQAVLVDQTSGVSLPSDAVPAEINRFG